MLGRSRETGACDFLHVTDLCFRSLFAFCIIELKSRKVIHIWVTRFPTDAWTCPGYLGYPFEKARDCARKIPLSHCHDEEIDTLARNIENRQANVQRRVTQMPWQPSRGLR
jgi:hypothetical protein